MLEFGWIKETLGEEGTGYTRIEPINEFKATLKSIGLKWVKQEPKPAESQIILKDRIEKKKVFVGFERILEKPDANHETPKVKTFVTGELQISWSSGSAGVVPNWQFYTKFPAI